MTRSVVTAAPSTSLRDAITKLLANGISGLPVVDEQRHLVGILTEGDLLRRRETQTETRLSRLLAFLKSSGSQAEEFVRENSQRVRDLMTDKVVTIGEEASLDEAVALMEKHDIKRVPVCRDGVLVGIISRSDFIRELARRLSDSTDGTRPDQEIQDELDAILSEQTWFNPQDVRTSVKDQVVSLDGVVIDVRTRLALWVAAENIQGVRRVEDRLTYVDPMTTTGVGI